MTLGVPPNPADRASHATDLAADFSERLSGESVAVSRTIFPTLGTCNEEEYWNNAPKNVVRNYSPPATKFMFMTEDMKQVQCVKVLLPSGVGSDNLDDIEHEVSTCGMFLVLTYPAPQLFADPTH
jgi:hypothetical protein